MGQKWQEREVQRGWREVRRVGLELGRCLWPFYIPHWQVGRSLQWEGWEGWELQVKMWEFHP